ncbi:triacylglycerol lipase, partial [Dispira parvispora]
LRWVQRAFNSYLGLVLAWVYLWAEVFHYWVLALHTWLARPSLQRELTERLHTATSYEQWYTSATQLDRLLGWEDWRHNPVSDLYDYRLIESRLERLCDIGITNDLTAMVFLLRSGLVRNLGGINEHQLFSRASHAGTKLLIEEYTYRVVNILEFIRQSDTLSIPRPLKASLFYDTRQCYGRTALVLNGGSTFGLCHLGVAKALWQHRLLPRIVYGKAVGALIGALLCCYDDQQLITLFQTLEIDLSAFLRVKRQGHLLRKLTRYFKFGYLMNVQVLEECIRDNIGDMTFEEAHRKTGRVLNIALSPQQNHESQLLLNYLTAPNVVIWTAACASTSQLGLFERVDLLIKDVQGQLRTWSPSLACEYSSSHWPSEVNQPNTRLAELFNVNHCIISDASLKNLPLFTWYTKFAPHWVRQLVRSTLGELLHQMRQLHQLCLLPTILAGFISRRVASNVTVSPSFTLVDLYNMYSRPTPASLHYWVLKGEQATWPRIPLIYNRCIIEFTLDNALDDFGKHSAFTRSKNHSSVDEVSKTEPPKRKRTQSFH